MSIYQQQNQNYQQQQAGMYGLMGGILKGGIGLLGASDERMKENITKIGSVLTPHGDDDLPIYSYKFKKGFDPSGATHIGPIAQDVEKLDPTAVREIGGIKHINYTKLGSVLGLAA